MTNAQLSKNVRALAAASGVEIGNNGEIKAGSSAGLASEYVLPSLNSTQPQGFGADPFISALVNNQAARNATVRRDQDGEYVIDSPYTVSVDSIVDAGDTCCICAGGTKACNHQTVMRPFCVFDCVENTMDTLMDNSPLVGQNQLETPYTKSGDSLARIRARKMATEFKFYFERNIILGTLTNSGNGLRPFDGIAQQVGNSSVYTISGVNGIQRAVTALKCRMAALGGSGSLASWIIGVNPLVLACLEDQLRNPITGNLPAGWTVSGGNISYRGARVVASVHIPVDMTNLNGGEAWMINTADVGIKLAFDMNKPYIVDDFTADNDGIDALDMANCLKKCVYMYNAGGAVVGSYNSIIRITDLAIDPACVAGMAGLGDFINPTTPFPALV